MGAPLFISYRTYGHMLLENPSGYHVAYFGNGDILVGGLQQDATQFRFYISKDGGKTLALLGSLSAHSSTDTMSFTVDQYDRIHVANGGINVYWVFGTVDTGHTAITWGTATTLETGTQWAQMVGAVAVHPDPQIAGNTKVHVVSMYTDGNYPPGARSFYQYNYRRYTVTSAGAITNEVASTVLTSGSGSVTGATTAPPQVAYAGVDNSNNVYLVYVGGFATVYLARLTAASTWAIPASVTAILSGVPSGERTLAAFTESDGTVHVTASPSTTSGYYYAQMKPDGTMPVANELITTTNSTNGDNIAIAAFQNIPYLVIGNGNNLVHLKRLGASSWAAPVTIDNLSRGIANPAVAVNKAAARLDALYVDNTPQGANPNDYYTAFYISYSLNKPPDAPTFSNISSSGYTLHGNPKQFISVSDPDAGNTITNVEIQVTTDSTFAAITYDRQYGSDAGYGTSGDVWTGLPTASNAASTVTFAFSGYPSSGIALNTWYMRCRAKDNNNAWGAWSAIQAFTIVAAPWNDSPSGFGLRAQWLNDLATVINNTRQFRGLATFSFTDGTITTGMDIKALHITERQQKLTDVLSIVSVTPSWTHASPTNTVDRGGQDIVDLRTYCVQT